ncbi:hypothetical protein [Bacillus sp. E(2018)]|uniref:hypothetical protein n=1 Tax=Bacillus sp. E(2018) TaxID=2502239 RepID=UPI0010F8574B|nr:hypothetical protein [Bacillus sp. E(2018)]
MNPMKKMLLLTFVFCTFFISLIGCQQNTLYFKGEGEYWEGSYITNLTSNTENGEFEFVYKDKGKVGDIVYSITSNTRESSGNLNIDGKKFTDSVSCSGCFKTDKNEEFKVIIKWDGKEDMFTLKK